MSHECNFCSITIRDLFSTGLHKLFFSDFHSAIRISLWLALYSLRVGWVKGLISVGGSERNQQEASIINWLPSCFQAGKGGIQASLGSRKWSLCLVDLCLQWSYSQALHQIQDWMLYWVWVWARSEETRLSNRVDIKIEQHVTLPKLVYGVTLLSSSFYVKYQKGQCRTLKSRDFLFLEMIRGFLQGMNY